LNNADIPPAINDRLSTIGIASSILPITVSSFFFFFSFFSLSSFFLFFGVPLG